MSLGNRLRTRRCRLVRWLRARKSGPRIILLGDSLTDSCYPLRLDRLLREAGSPVRSVTVARSGFTARSLLDCAVRRLPHLLRRRNPVVGVVILVGTNDLKRGTGYDFDGVVRDIAALLKTVQRFWPNAFMITCTIPVPGPDIHPALPALSPHLARAELNPRLRRSAEESGALCCDLEDLFAERHACRFDGVHLTAEGDDLLAGTIWVHVRELLRI